MGMVLTPFALRNRTLATALTGNQEGMMPRTFTTAVLLSVALTLAACGSSNQLKSISVSPARATAFSAQFTATGEYSNGSKVTPLSVTWTNYDPSSPPPPLPGGWPAISSTGLAQCGPQAYTATMWASVRTHSALISGTAQIVCP